MQHFLFSILDSDWTTRMTYCVKHLSGMGSRNAETCPRLDDGCCWESDDHCAYVSLQHLPTKCPEKQQQY